VLVGLSVRVLFFAPAPARVALGGQSMGTSWSVVLNAPGIDRAARTDLQQAVQAALDRVDRAMSTWDPASEVSRFNAHRSLEPFAVSAPTLEVLRIARDVSAASGGAFDVTVRPLVAVWGFGADARRAEDPPTPERLERIRARVGYERLRLPASGNAIRKTVPDLEIDLSAVAKGYGVDRAADALREAGYRDFLVEVGGEVAASGSRPGGGPWRLAIERPDVDGRAVYGVIGISDRAMATSGDYRSFRDAGGRRISHLIDPRTGQPVTHGVASVSVVAATTAVADAWATALSVLAPGEGEALARKLGLAVYWIFRETDGSYRNLATPAFPPVAVPEAG